jgi:hypothetical protein
MEVVFSFPAFPIHGLFRRKIDDDGMAGVIPPSTPIRQREGEEKG